MIYTLSERETEVLELMAGGLTTTEIAGKLYLSTETIKTHRTKIVYKLDARNGLNAVIKAIKMGLLNLNSVA